MSLFFWYPGGGRYIELFAFNKDFFTNETSQKPVSVVAPVPYVVNPMITPEVTAQAVYIVDRRSYSPVYGINEHVRFPPASTIKIITALTALDVYPLDTVITVKNSTDIGQTIKLVTGEKITVENLLYGILVGSGNDAAYALADGYKNGFLAFIQLMNKNALRFGMKDTFIIDPAGLDRFGQYTTAFDLALAGRELLDNPILAKMVSTKQITISDVDFKIFHPLENINILLGEIPGLGGLKTGYTENAGQHLVSLYKKDNHEFIIVVLKSEDRFEDTKSIVRWINENVGFLDTMTN